MLGKLFDISEGLEESKRHKGDEPRADEETDEPHLVPLEKLSL